MTTDVLDELEWRGLIAQSTDRDELRKALADAPLTLYAGFDPTAPSLHAGNLVPLLTLRRFQLAGHRPIALAGGATGLIGDPSGRSDERSLNTADTVADWADRVGGQLARFLDFTPGPTAATLVDNLAWTAPLSAIDFLRDIGKHFSVNAMLAKDSVSSRLEGGISFAEFSYMVLQSNDYLELFRREGCRLQIGGSDQWGNITAGLDLIRRVAGGAGHGLTVPLVTSASGEKFGKSTGGGRLWLDPVLTSPYAFYQYWINVDDRDVVPYLRYFTFRSREETDELAVAAADRPQAREAQRALATDLTSLVHGAEETARVEEASRALFGRGSLADLDVATLAAALAEASLVPVTGPELPPVAELLVLTGLCSTRSEARRAIEQGGAYLNNRKVTDSNEVPAAEDLLDGRYVVVRKGRRNVAGVERVL